MDPVVGGALIGGAVNLISSAGSTAATNVANANLNKKNREWQEKMTALQYQRNIEMWNMQNRYNLPVAQIQRLRAAGLNPNLMYGNGSGSTGMASDISSADVPSTPSTIPYDFSQASNGVASALAMYQNWQLNNLNMEKVRNESQNIEAQTAYNRALTAGRLINNDIDRVTRSMAQKNAEIDYLMKHAGLNKTVADTWLSNSNRRATELAMYQDAASFGIKMDLWTAQAYNQRANALNAIANARDAEARIKSGLYGAQAGLYRADAGLKNQQHDFNAFYYDRGLPVPSGNLMGIPNTFLGMFGKNVAEPVGNWIDKQIDKFKRK